MLEQPGERPFGSPVRRFQRTRNAGRGGLIETHDRTGMADIVVCRRCPVGVGVVLVEPGAVRLLVAYEPGRGRCGGGPQVGDAHRGAELGRRQRRERSSAHGDEYRCSQRRSPDRAPAHARSGSGSGRGATGEDWTIELVVWP
jgi:hypothetical protein